MDFEKYTDKSKQAYKMRNRWALRLGHQRFEPVHSWPRCWKTCEHLSEKLIIASGGNVQCG